MISFEKRTALITGASSGIGKAFAESLAAKGANLILVARSGDKLKSLASQIKNQFKVDCQGHCGWTLVTQRHLQRFP